jgi:hypothetical protein
LWVDAGESAEGLGCVVTFAAGESDVGVVGAGFGSEAAWSGRGDDGLLEDEERGCGPDVDIEDARVIEDTGGFEANGDVGEMNFAETREDAIVVLLVCAAQELQRDVPGFGGGPAEIVFLGAETGFKFYDFVDYVRG